MTSFYMNGYLWFIEVVNPYSSKLVDRTRQLRLATTDPVEKVVYLSDRLRGEKLITVLIHELGHCAIVSFDLLDEIHRMVKPKYWVEAEEFMCNFIADYGVQIFKSAYRVLGNKALLYIPSEIERFVA